MPVVYRKRSYVLNILYHHVIKINQKTIFSILSPKDIGFEITVHLSDLMKTVNSDLDLDSGIIAEKLEYDSK